jgi:PEP-CTERM motif
LNYPVRRVRRSRRRSRRRRVRRVATLLVVLLLLGFGAFLLSSRYSYLVPGASYANSRSEWIQANPSQNLASLAGGAAEPATPPLAGRLVYPYSVVPGGIHDLQELREAIRRDRLVASHYSDFDFKNARVIELKRGRLAYMSYRLGEKIFWTKRQMALRAGEKLLTDGKVMARTRCGNRVAMLPQKEVSPDEPRAEAFEDPALGGAGIAHLAYPTNFESALLTRSRPADFGPQPPPLGYVGPLSGVPGGGFPGIFPPPIPSGGCAPVLKRPKPHEIGPEVEESKSAKKKKDPCHPGPPGTVPEPGTMVLVASGLVGVYARYRKTRKAARHPIEG